MAHFEDQKNLRKKGFNYHPSIGTGPIADPYRAPRIFVPTIPDFQDAEAEAWHEGHESSTFCEGLEPPFFEEDFSGAKTPFFRIGMLYRGNPEILGNTFSNQSLEVQDGLDRPYGYKRSDLLFFFTKSKSSTYIEFSGSFFASSKKLVQLWFLIGLSFTSRISHSFFSIAYPLALGFNEIHFLWSNWWGWIKTRLQGVGLQFGAPTLIFLDMYGINLITTGKQKKTHMIFRQGMIWAGLFQPSSGSFVYFVSFGYVVQGEDAVFPHIFFCRRAYQ